MLGKLEVCGLPCCLPERILSFESHVLLVVGSWLVGESFRDLEVDCFVEHDFVPTFDPCEDITIDEQATVV